MRLCKIPNKEKLINDIKIKKRLLLFIHLMKVLTKNIFEQQRKSSLIGCKIKVNNSKKLRKKF